MKRKAFLLLIVSSLAHAQSQDTFFSTISSWMANHRLGIAGIGFIGGGFIAKCYIQSVENKRLHRYRLNNVVNTPNMKASEISTLLNKKVKNGFSESSQIGEYYENSILNFTFKKITILGKELEDKIELKSVAGQPITCFKAKEITIISQDTKITVEHQRELKKIAYADWVQRAFVAIGALAVFKSFALSNR